MTFLKTTLMTAALMAVPSIAFAQISDLKAAATDKAVETVLENATTDDALVAGKTLLTGGSKEDAAMAIVKGRVDDKIEGVTGGVSVDEFSKDGVMKAGKEIAMEKAKSSATTYTDGASVGGVSLGDVGSATGAVGSVSKDGLLDAGKAMAVDKAKSSATTYTDGASVGGVSLGDVGSATGAVGSVSKDGLLDAGKAMAADKATSSATTYSDTASGVVGSGVAVPAASVPAVPAINCPSGTKATAEGTCMITGDFGF